MCVHKPGEKSERQWLGLWRSEIWLVFPFVHSFQGLRGSDSPPVPHVCFCCFPRWHQGDRIRPDQDVHEASEHRSQAEAVLQVRTVVSPRSQTALMTSGYKALTRSITRLEQRGFPGDVKSPQPVSHHCLSRCSLTKKLPRLLVYSWLLWASATARGLSPVAAAGAGLRVWSGFPVALASLVAGHRL